MSAGPRYRGTNRRVYLGGRRPAHGHRPVDELGNQQSLAGFVGVERGDDAGREVALRLDVEPGRGELRSPTVDVVARVEVRVQTARDESRAAPRPLPTSSTCRPPGGAPAATAS
jgi:hypothetical protein